MSRGGPDVFRLSPVREGQLPFPTAMELRFLVVPYDSALRGFRMGAGPERLVSAGLANSLESAGHRVEIEVLAPPSESPPAEIRTAFELNRLLSRRVHAADAAGAIPIVLAGNCISAVGTLAGLNSRRCGVLWFDGHGDFNTPETTTGGFLDGMALATLTGRCWTQLAATVEGHRPIPEQDVLLIGARDLDPLEGEALRNSAVCILPPERAATGLDAALRDLRTRVADVYVHLDLDVLDPAEGRANGLAAPNGLSLDHLLSAVERIRSSFAVRGVALTAYDPSFDPGGEVTRAAVSLLKAAVSAGAQPPA